MDPLSLTLAATALITTLAQAVGLTMTVVERLKSRRKILLELVSETERVRLYCQMMESLSRQLANAEQRGIALAFDKSACEVAARAVLDFARELSAPGVLGSIMNNLKSLNINDRAEALMVSLRRSQDNLQTVLQLIAVRSTVTTEAKMDKLLEQMKAQAEPKVVLVEVSPPARAPLPPYETSLQAKAPPSYEESQPYIWHCDVIKEGLPTTYCQLRDTLTNSARNGQWTTVFCTLSHGQSYFQQSWVDCTRLNTLADGKAYGWSHWTPLHQAVFWAAPEETVQGLLRLGAKRTLRTTYAEPARYAYRDLSPLEMAQIMGRPYLYHLLAPRIHQHIPHRTLDVLERRFHALIHKQLNTDIVEGRCMRLPQLSVLTEMVDPEMHVYTYAKASKSTPLAYTVRLDGRTLKVRSYVDDSGKISQLFEITEEGVEEIDEAYGFVKMQDELAG